MLKHPDKFVGRTDAAGVARSRGRLRLDTRPPLWQRVDPRQVTHCTAARAFQAFWQDGCILGNVMLIEQDLTALPDFRGIEVKGFFSCARNPRLTSLAGAPSVVGDYLDCSGCGLKSLRGCPRVRKLICHSNPGNVGLDPPVKTSWGAVDFTFSHRELRLAMAGKLPWPTLGGLRLDEAARSEP